MGDRGIVTKKNVLCCTVKGKTSWKQQFCRILKMHSTIQRGDFLFYQSNILAQYLYFSSSMTFGYFLNTESDKPTDKCREKRKLSARFLGPRNC